MSANTYSSFAIAGGSGTLGSLITKELIANGARVIILSRSEIEAPAGTTVRVADYANEDSLVTALDGVEVVISALPSAAAHVQPALANASKRVGVKLFVPSEYGAITDILPEDGLHAAKVKFQAYIKEIGLPFTLFYTGFFADGVFSAPIGFDVPNKSISFVGEGKTPVSFTTKPDIARFMGYVLTHQPATKLANATLRVEGDNKTWRELVPIFEDVYGGPFKVNTRSIPETEDKVARLGRAVFPDYLLLLAEKGAVNLGTNDNELVPNFKPLTIREALAKYFARE